MKGDFDGLTDDSRSRILSNPDSKVVYLSYLAKVYPSKVPSSFEVSNEEVIVACERFILAHQDESSWHQNPLNNYVSYAFNRVPNSGIKNLEDVVMSYVRTDFENNPVNDALFDTAFFGGNLELIQDYTDYVFTLMGKGLSLEEMGQDTAAYVETIAEVVKTLAKLDNPSAQTLGEKISSKLAEKFAGDDQTKVINTLRGILGLSLSNLEIATSSAPEAEEVVGKVTQSEADTKESADVVTVEINEEPVEKSSNWWLWLIGIAVIAGGLSLALRRKN